MFALVCFPFEICINRYLFLYILHKMINHVIFSRPCINQSYNEGVSKSTIIAIITRKIDNQQKSPFEAESLFNKSMICLLKESTEYCVFMP